mmetsp:Transcript_14425/g.47045  ORF Transcript_14425/g.47045 Transcript_14425/m.47045 type:complete len:207 (-) Transcript_14425:635-1255(-)
MMVTMRLPLFSGRSATLVAARTAAPEEMPQRMPSCVAISRAMSMASKESMGTTSSKRVVSALPGMKPAPMPWILWGPAAPPERTGDSAGSTATTLSFGLRGLRHWAQPVRVPPVPTPPRRMSMRPSHCFHISGPVCSRWILGLSGLLNCWRRKALSAPRTSTICSALRTAPDMPFLPGVKISSAPNALNMTRRSMDIVSGIVRIKS